MKFKAKWTVGHNGKKFEEGDPIDLNPETKVDADLIASGAVEKVVENKKPAPKGDAGGETKPATSRPKGRSRSRSKKSTAKS